MTHLLRKTLLAACILSVAVLACAGEPELTGQELFARSRSLAKVKETNSEYQVHLDLKIFGLTSVPVTGRMEYAWRSPAQWHREISIPNYFREIDTSGDQVIYKDRSVEYEPLRVSLAYELISLATATEMGKDFQWGKVHSGPRENCAEAKLGKYVRKYCFDSATGALLKVEDPSMRSEYGEFQKLGDRVLPTSLRFFHKNKLTIEAIAKWDFETHVPEDLFKPSAGAVDWAACDGMVPPKEDFTPEPRYPTGKPGVTGDDADVLVYATVAADGKLRMPYVIESGGVEFDRAAVIAIRDWHFHPATCDGKPVAVQIQVEIRFHYGRGGPYMPIYR